MNMLSHMCKKICGRISGYITERYSSLGEVPLFRFDIISGVPRNFVRGGEGFNKFS